MAKFKITGVTAYRRVPEGLHAGEKVSKVVAFHADTQVGLTAETEKAARPAKAMLRIHRDKGHSRIVVHRDRKYMPDMLFTLNDDRGYGIASAVEYGHEGRDGKFHPGAHPLTYALGKARQREGRYR